MKTKFEIIGFLSGITFWRKVLSKGNVWIENYKYTRSPKQGKFGLDLYKKMDNVYVPKNDHLKVKVTIEILEE